MIRFHRGIWPVLLALLLSLATPTLAKDKNKKPVTDAKEQMEFGVDMAKRGLWSEALFRFKQANRLEPGNPRTLNNIAVSFEALGLFDQALDHYQQAIKGDPSNKDLKRNYSRFVEFYRSFQTQPPSEDGNDGQSGPTAADRGGP